MVDAGEVERDAVARADARRPARRAVWMRADPRRARRRADVDVLVGRAATPPVSVPVTTVPLPLAANDAVDPQPRPAAVGGGRRARRERVERAAQLVEPGAGRRG